MAEVDRLKTLLDDVLAAVVALWPAEAAELPALQYVANGAVPWDGCETLAVSLDRTFGAPSGDPTLEQMTVQPALILIRCAVIDVFLLRCVPTVTDSGAMPAPADVEASADIILRDAQALTNVIVEAAANGTIPGCKALSLENWTAAGPEGGMGGGILRIRVVAL